MLKPKNIPESNASYVDVVNTVGDMGFVKDGKLYKHSDATSIMVNSSSELASLACEPGSVAFTAGFENMWQLDASGQWVSI